jgi:hypothetical protein
MPGAAVDDHHHRVPPDAARQMQVHALGATASIVEGMPALEEVEDQARAVHSRRS